MSLAAPGLTPHAAPCLARAAVPRGPWPSRQSAVALLATAAYVHLRQSAGKRHRLRSCRRADCDSSAATTPGAGAKFEVRSVGKKGLGAVATVAIRRGEIILEEAPSLLFEHRAFEVLFGDLEDILESPAAFEQWEKSLAGSVDSGSPEARKRFWELADTCAGENAPKTALGIARTNALSIGESLAGLFLDVSRFNHSCKPNVHHSWQGDKGQQVLRACCDVEAGEELCISYLSLLELCAPREERLGQVSDRFGFDCTCQACSAGRVAESDERRERLAQLCEAFSEPVQERGREMLLELRPPVPLFYELEAGETAEATLHQWQQEAAVASEEEEESLERLDMREGLREAVALLDEELNGSPAARALFFFGAFRRALAAGKVSAAASLATAAWRGAAASEGPESWRAKRLKAYAQDPRRFAARAPVADRVSMHVGS